MSIIKTDNPYILEAKLNHWFRFDHLNSHDGISVLLGVEPYKDLFNGEHEDIEEFLTFGITLINGDEIIAPISDEEAMKYSKQLFEPYLFNHYRFTNYWNSGKHPDQTPLKYYVEWAKSKGIPPKWMDTAIKLGLIEIDGKSDSESRDYFKSESLQYLNQAASIFWNKRKVDQEDPTTHPKKNEIVSWLESKGFTTTLATHGATIIRPKWAHGGRYPEK